MATVPTFCGKDCGGTACPLLAHVEGGRVRSITNNPAGGRYLRGCPRSTHLIHTTYAPDRLLQPLVRTGPRGSGQFRTATWEEALKLTAEALGEVRARYGPQAVLNLASAGSIGALHSTGSLLRRFLACYGGCTQQTGNYSNPAACFVLPYVLGSEWRSSGADPATLQHSRMIILWGANVLDTRLGTELPLRVLEAHRKGIPVITIDPRRTATVKQATSWWLQIRPGADSALMLAVLHVLISESLIDRPFVEAHSVGFDELERYVTGAAGGEAHTPEWAEAVCGIPAGEIRRFARAYAAAKPTALIPGYSIQRVYAGEETYRLSVALQVATGNFGVRGGSTGSLNNRLPGPRLGHLPIPEISDQPAVPVLRWPDAVLEGRKGGYPSDIHAIYSLGGNFANQGADVRKNLAAFEKVDFAVCHEVFLTPTARCCDVVFPAATALEKEDVASPWLGNFLVYKPQAVSPQGQVRNDYDILWDLAERLGFGPAFSQGRSAQEWIDHFIAESEVPDPEAFRRTGLYLAPNQERVGLAEFAADPQGHPLHTLSGKVEISSARYQGETGFPAIPTWRPAPSDARYPLQLISPKLGLFTHSQGANLPAIAGRAGMELSLHPVDAARRGIAEGDPVRVYNAQGACRVKAHLTEDLLPGVACLPEGVWFTLDAQGEDTAGSANLLTSTEGSTPSVGCVMHGVGVEIERVNAHG